MDREKFVKWSGWALMAGAILFAAGLILGNFDSDWNDPIGGVDAFYEISQIVGMGLGSDLVRAGSARAALRIRGTQWRCGKMDAAASVAGGVVSSPECW